MRPCVYASATRGIHDDRWVAALASHGFAPSVIVRDPSEDEASFRGRVEACSGPILAGPLDTVTRALLGLPGLVGLSWGFDLHRMSDAEVRKLSSLGGLIVDSDATRDRAVAAGVPAERVTFLPWGIDLASFDSSGPVADAIALGLDADAYLVTMRAHEPLYRVRDVIEGFAAIADDYPRLGLVVGHSGSLTGALRDRVLELGLSSRVSFVGTIPESELAPLLRGAAAYVTASEVDGTSVTLLQAMACLTPVVASDTPGNRAWVIDGETGGTFRTGDPVSLASALRTALSASDRQPVLRARDLVEVSADWPRNTARLRDAMLAVVAR